MFPFQKFENTASLRVKKGQKIEKSKNRKIEKSKKKRSPGEERSAQGAQEASEVLTSDSGANHFADTEFQILDPATQSERVSGLRSPRPRSLDFGSNFEAFLGGF